MSSRHFSLNITFLGGRDPCLGECILVLLVDMDVSLEELCFLSEESFFKLAIDQVTTSYLLSFVHSPHHIDKDYLVLLVVFFAIIWIACIPSMVASSCTRSILCKLDMVLKTNFRCGI